MNDFEIWLKKVCFQAPTTEAYDLAKCAWLEAQKMEREACAKVCETAEVLIDIDVWMGTKKALTAATAIGLATEIRKRSNG